jgi:hypothetical protein
MCVKRSGFQVNVQKEVISGEKKEMVMQTQHLISKLQLLNIKFLSLVADNPAILVNAIFFAMVNDVLYILLYFPF